MLGTLVLGVGTVQAQDSAATRQLVEQGRFWDQRQQPQRAQEAWQRVLSADPVNAEALERLSVLNAEAGNRLRAQQYLDQLSQSAPNSPLLAQARKALASGGAAAGGKSTALTRARTLAAGRDYAGAVAAYRESFGGDPPDGPLALEYYQTLGATADGWNIARDALGELARKHPDDPRYALAYAQHLSYREGGRREGIDQLAELSQGSAVSVDARSAWRQALLWLQPKADDAPRYARYLSVFGHDADIQARLDSLHSAGDTHAAEERGAQLRDTYTQINAGQFDPAEQFLDAQLKLHPGNADLHGALGVLRLRQGHFADAASLLRQAQQEQPSTAGNWTSALRSATFWEHVQGAQAARTANDLAGAASQYASAFAQAPPDAPDALRVAYADVLIEQQKDSAAEALEREVLRHQPDNPDALRGLITVLGRNGHREEALQLADRAPPQVQGQLSGLRADDLRSRAAAARARGDQDEAQADLEQALLLAPESPWVRLDLAAVYRAQGKPEQAQTLLSGLASSNGDLPEVRMAQAYADGEAGNWGQVLQELEQLPAAQRNVEAARLQHRAWVRYQLQRADQAAAAHQMAEAYTIVEEAGSATGSDPELLAAVASGWAALGDPARAIGYMRRAIAQSGNGADPALRVQYAGLLLSAGQDGEFEVVADDLATRAILSSKQQQDLDSMLVGYRVKLADHDRVAGNLGDAYIQLRDVVARYPDDPRVQMALGRLLTASGDLDQSAAIYKALLARDPGNSDAQLGLIDSRLAASDQEAARSLIKSGLHDHPDDPRYWQDSARLDEAEGRRADALNDVRQADLLNGKTTAPSDQPPPQLAWIDPSRPDQALPAPVVNVLREVAPSTGPLRPRATELALPPAATPPGQAYAVQTEGGMMAPAGAQPYGLAGRLGSGEHGAWLAPPARPALRLRTAQSISYDGLAALPNHGGGASAGGSAAASSDHGGSLPPTDDAARLEAETSGWVGGAFAERSRAGTPGLSQLSDLEVPIQWRSRESSVGRFGLDVTPVYLDAGSASGVGLEQYGTLALLTSFTTVGGVVSAVPPTQVSTTSSAGGVALGLNYSYGWFAGDIGTTPLGFNEERLVGGVKIGLSPGDWRLNLDLSRRAVTESLLAYAGEMDPLTGKDWGGVSRTGGRGDVVYDSGGIGLYGNAGFYSLDGHNVDTNTEISFGGGGYAHGWKTATQSFTYGINLTGFSYDKNLSNFTFGQGGYFSPQLFLALTVPVELSGQHGGFTYDLKGALGVQSFREDGNAFYPGFAGLQQELVARGANLNVTGSSAFQSGYAAQSSSGLGYSFNGALEYRLRPRLSVGGLFGVDNARDYREMQLVGYIRYYFDPQLQVPATVSPVKPFYSSP
jgi:tetratricopeptide (TPR) repeat protein